MSNSDYTKENSFGKNGSRLDHFVIVNSANHPWAEAVLSQLPLLTGLLLRYVPGVFEPTHPSTGFKVLVGEPGLEEHNDLLCFKFGNDEPKIVEGRVIVGDRILFRLGELLSLSEKHTSSENNPLPSLVGEAPLKLELHKHIFLLTKAFQMACSLRGLVLQRMAYPGGKRFAVALTHDVDYMEIGWLNRLKFSRSLLLAIKNRKVADLWREKQLFQVLNSIIRNGGQFNFPYLKSIEEGVNATSALNLCTYLPRVEDKWKHRIINPGYKLENFPFEKAIESEFEIGIHGSTAAHDSAERFQNEVDQLRQFVNVTSGRYHTLALSLPDSFYHQVNAGLLCDSSIGFNASLTFPLRGSVCFLPIDKHTKKAIKLVQIPLMLMDSSLIKCGYLLKSDMLPIAIRLAELASLHGMAFSICWHDHLFFEGSYLAGVYQNILEIMVEQGGWLCTPTELALFHSQLSEIQWQLSNENKWIPMDTTDTIPASWVDTVRPVTSAKNV